MTKPLPKPDEIDGGLPPFLRTRPVPPDECPPGDAWRYRVAWTPEENGLVTIADERMTSTADSAQPMEGFGAVIEIGEEVCHWLWHALGELIDHRSPDLLRCGCIVGPPHGSKDPRCGNAARRRFKLHPEVGICDACFQLATIDAARVHSRKTPSEVLAHMEERYPLIGGAT